MKVFEAARRSPGTDEDVVMVSWLPEPKISYLREKPSWQLPDALLSACYQGKSRMVLDLLKSAASEVRKLRTTPLIVASWRGHADVAGVLLERRQRKVDIWRWEWIVYKNIIMYSVYIYIYIYRDI